MELSKDRGTYSSEDEANFETPHESPKDSTEHLQEFHDIEEHLDTQDSAAKGQASNGVAREGSSNHSSTQSVGGVSRDKPQPAPLSPRTTWDGGEISNEGVEDIEELTETEKKALECAEEKKAEGNCLYKESKWLESLEAYREAIRLCPVKSSEPKALYHANAAQSNLQLEEYEEAAKDATTCLRLRPVPHIKVKALARRAAAYEKLNDKIRAFNDYEQLMTLEPTVSSHKQKVDKLKPEVETEQEKTKEEMIEKLKELGNSVLGKFNMSLDNFKAEKDPETGQFSISMKQ